MTFRRLTGVQTTFYNKKGKPEASDLYKVKDRFAQSLSLPFVRITSLTSSNVFKCCNVYKQLPFACSRNWRHSDVTRLVHHSWPRNAFCPRSEMTRDKCTTCDDVCALGMQMLHALSPLCCLLFNYYYKTIVGMHVFVQAGSCSGIGRNTWQVW